MFAKQMYIQTEIETANLSQCYFGLNLSHLQVYCLYYRNSSTETKNKWNMHLTLEINYKDP